MALSTLENRRLQEDLLMAFQYVMGTYRKIQGRLFNRPFPERTRGNGFELRGRFILNIRKKCYNEGGETLEQVTQRSCEWPTTEVFKFRLHMVLSNLI